MLLELLLLFGCAVSSRQDYVLDLSDCLTAIADRYLRSTCLAFLFPLNFSEPAFPELPLVRSPLLKNVLSRWPTHLPAKNSYDMHFPYIEPEPGPISYLRCAHIIILDGGLSYTDQIYRVLYTFYSHYYVNGGGERTRMVIAVSSVVMEPEILQLFSYMFKMGDMDVVFVGIANDTVTIFSVYPFGKDGSTCPESSLSLVTIDSWVDDDFVRGTDLFPAKIPGRFNDCSIKVGTVHNPPYFIIEQDQPTGGVEYLIIEIIARHLGLRIQYQFYDGPNSYFWIDEHGPHGTSVDLRRGDVWFLVSGNANFIFTFSCTFVPHSFLPCHVSWFFKNPSEIPNWKLIYVGFEHSLWIMITVTAILFPICVFVLTKFRNDGQPIQRLLTSMIATCGLIVAQPSKTKPKHDIFRLVFAAWLFYTIHINLAYSAALTSLLTAGKFESKIDSFQEIIQRKIKTAMPKYFVYQTVEIDEPIVKEVLSNHVVVDDYSLIYPQVVEWGNVSLLEVDVSFAYKNRKGNLSIYNSGINLGFTYIGIKLRRNHFIVDRIAELSARIFESGLTTKFIQDYTVVMKETRESKFKCFTVVDLAGPFLVLGVGCFLSFLLFLGEVIEDRFKRYLMKKQKK